MQSLFFLYKKKKKKERRSEVKEGQHPLRDRKRRHTAFKSTMQSTRKLCYTNKLHGNILLFNISKVRSSQSWQDQQEMKNEFNREAGKQTSSLYNQCFIVNFLDLTFCERQLLIGSRWICEERRRGKNAIKESDSSDIRPELWPFSQQYNWNVKKGGADGNGQRKRGVGGDREGGKCWVLCWVLW